MFLQLLASQLEKAPDIGGEIRDDQAFVRNLQGITSIQELIKVSVITRKLYAIDRPSERVDLTVLETQFLKTPHFVSQTMLEEEFV